MSSELITKQKNNKKNNPPEKRNVSCTQLLHILHIHVFIECVHQPKNTPEGEFCTRFEYNHRNGHFNIPGVRCTATQNHAVLTIKYMWPILDA